MRTCCEDMGRQWKTWQDYFGEIMNDFGKVRTTKNYTEYTSHSRIIKSESHSNTSRHPKSCRTEDPETHWYDFFGIKTRMLYRTTLVRHFAFLVFQLCPLQCRTVEEVSSLAQQDVPDWSTESTLTFPITRPTRPTRPVWQPQPRPLELPFEPRSWESEETVEMDKSSLRSFTQNTKTLAMQTKSKKSKLSKASRQLNRPVF